MIHIAGTSMIEAGIDRIFRENSLGGMIIGLNPLHFPVISRSGSNIGQVVAMDQYLVGGGVLPV